MFPIVSFHHDTGKELPVFRLRVASDFGWLEDALCRCDITAETNPMVPPKLAVAKNFLFVLEEREGFAVASCEASFANGATFQRRDGVPESILEYMKIPDLFRDRLGKWIVGGKSFIVIKSFRARSGEDGGIFAKWFSKNLPRILSDVYGLTFQKTAVILHMYDKDNATEKEIRKIVKAKSVWIGQIVDECGYLRIDYGDWELLLGENG